LSKSELIHTAADLSFLHTDYLWRMAGSWVGTALDFTVRHRRRYLALCRKLIEVGTYGSSTPLDTYRGDILCLRVDSIGEAAQLWVDSTPTGQLAKTIWEWMGRTRFGCKFFLEFLEEGREGKKLLRA
jgi:hypothetical protein